MKLDKFSGSLRTISPVRPLYMLPAEPLADEVLIPGFRESAQVDCMVGFFSSEVLAALAPGLATYIAGTTSSFRLLISPYEIIQHTLLRPPSDYAIIK